MAGSGRLENAGSYLRLHRVIVIHRQRRMVAKALFLVDAGRARGVRDARRGDLIINAPAYIFRPRLAAIRPPGVGFQFGMQFAEHVHEADFAE